jgi:hypothetical protein
MIDTETGEIKAKKLAHIKDEFSEFIGDKSGTRMVIESWRSTAVSDLKERIIYYPQVRDSRCIKVHYVTSENLGVCCCHHKE